MKTIPQARYTLDYGGCASSRFRQVTYMTNVPTRILPFFVPEKLKTGTFLHVKLTHTVYQKVHQKVYF